MLRGVTPCFYGGPTLTGEVDARSWLNRKLYLNGIQQRRGLAAAIDADPGDSDGILRGIFEFDFESTAGPWLPPSMRTPMTAMGS